jgi:hypothetical protein
MWTPGLIAIILHASHNLFIQSVFDGLTRDTGVTLYITTDFGAGLALFYGITAVLIWRGKKFSLQNAKASLMDKILN